MFVCFASFCDAGHGTSLDGGQIRTRHVVGAARLSQQRAELERLLLRAVGGPPDDLATNGELQGDSGHRRRIDAGDLCGRPKTGVLATNRIEHILALDADVVLPWDGRDHYLAGIYRTALTTRADELVAHGRRSMRALVETADTQRVVMDRQRALVNVNSPTDFI